jgi:uncharacterized protein Yka (UPF0111/DUF47 family)
VSVGVQDVIEDMAEPALLVPERVARALEANDHAKYFLALLQAARARGDDPAADFASLREERLAAGIADPRFDRVVERSRRVGDDLYLIPDAATVHAGLVAAIEEMLAALDLGGAGDEVDHARLDALLYSSPDLAGDQVPGGYIDRITSGQPDAGDSLHLLVMDAHRALNQLHTRCATGTVDGAAVYGLGDGDGVLVSAFMAGLHATEQLKFDHPGLGTTATRVGSRLLIQNDLGTTEAHVVVIAVEGLVVTTTYTDVHRRRLEFFESLMDRYPVRWSTAQDRRGGPRLGDHYVTTGRYAAPDRDSLLGYLRWLGSRLVFVLDWNRARKCLRGLVGNRDAIASLRWAAENDYGHMAFLLLGGERLIYDTVELAAQVPARYGEPLIDVLGSEATLAILRFALRVAAQGLLEGRSHLLIRDELRAEVLNHVHTSHRRLLEAGTEHASLVVETAQALRSALVRVGTPDGTAFLNRKAAQAARWEHRADEILVGMRQSARRVDRGEEITALTTMADDAIDALEEAIFLLTLLPEEAASTAQAVLDSIADTSVATARAHLKALAIAREIVEGPGPDDVEDFLVAVDQVVNLEHEADRADRAARAALVVQAPDFRSLYVTDSVSRATEEATDALLRSTLGLRDRILASVTTR